MYIAFKNDIRFSRCTILNSEKRTTKEWCLPEVEVSVMVVHKS